MTQSVIHGAENYISKIHLFLKNSVKETMRSLSCLTFSRKSTNKADHHLMRLSHPFPDFGKKIK